MTDKGILIEKFKRNEHLLLKVRYSKKILSIFLNDFILKRRDEFDSYFVTRTVV